MRLRPVLLLFAVLATLAGTAQALVSSGRSAAPEGRAAKPALRVSARVQGLLYPGVGRAVVVRVGNLERRALVIRRARVLVRRPPHGCPSWSLPDAIFRGRVSLPARAVRRLYLEARIAPNAPDACRGGGFRLLVRARASAPGAR